MLTEREVGTRAVRAAARVCEAVRMTMRTPMAGSLDKQDHSPVTVADFGVQAVVCRMIDAAFPQDAIVAEEDSTLLRREVAAGYLAAVRQIVATAIGAIDEEALCYWIDRGQGAPADRFWVLDPIDGTRGFLRHDQYAIALALIEQGVPVCGFLACPALSSSVGVGVMFVAQRGAGVECLTLDGTSLGQVCVRRVTDPARIRMVESVEAAHTNHGLAHQLRLALGISEQPLYMDSQAKYGAVARGDADLYLRSPHPRTPDYREHLWDHAAGWLIVNEAGGMVTDVYGRALDWSQGRRLERNIGVLASNGYLHERLLHALIPLLPPQC